MTKYSDNGFWLTREANTVTLGLSAKGQDDLGDISFVELLQQDTYTTEDSLLSVEAAKAVTELLSPVSGRVVLWHTEVEDHPEYLNDTDTELNWIVRLTDVPEADWDALLDVMPACPA